MPLTRENSADSYNRKFSNGYAYIDKKWVLVRDCRTQDDGTLYLRIMSQADRSYEPCFTEPEYKLFLTGFYVFEDRVYCVTRIPQERNYQVCVSPGHTHGIYFWTSRAWRSIRDSDKVIPFLNKAKPLSLDNSTARFVYMAPLWCRIGDTLYYSTKKVGKIVDGKYVGYRQLPKQVLEAL